MPAVTIRSIDPIVVALPRDTPYLGPLAAGEEVNRRGYFVRKGNRTIYPTVDRSVLVRMTASDGTIGWGETYGIVAPEAVVAILRDVMIPLVEGRSPDDPAAIYRDLYDLMRVRGGSGGFYGDALAAIDIALWDVKARLPAFRWQRRSVARARDAFLRMCRGCRAPRSTSAWRWPASGAIAASMAIKYAAVDVG